MASTAVQRLSVLGLFKQAKALSSFSAPMPMTMSVYANGSMFISDKGMNFTRIQLRFIHNHDIPESLEDVTFAQGVQGDSCELYTVWRDNCRRHNFLNCDEQLQGIQTGRKTLSQVLREQDEQIRQYAELHRKKSSISAANPDFAA